MKGQIINNTISGNVHYENTGASSMREKIHDLTIGMSVAYNK